MYGVFGHRVKAVFRRRMSSTNLVFQIIINDLAMVVCGKVVKDREGKKSLLFLLLISSSHYPNYPYYLRF